MLTFRFGVGQFNFLVGGIEVNTKKILDAMQKARELKIDFLVFPELALCGYPPEDLLLREDFKQQINEALKAIQEDSSDIPILLGHPHYTEQEIYNAASLIQNKTLITTYHKQCLPNYGVFDERRYFTSGDSSGLIIVKGISIGILICEDLWHPEPILKAKQAGAELIICINASPFDLSKAQERTRALKINIKETRLPILYINGINGQDDLVFDGGSQAFNADATLCAQAGFFEEKLWTVELTQPLIYSQHLDFRQSATKMDDHSAYEIRENCEKSGNTTDTLSAKRILQFIPQELPSKLSVEESIYKALVLAVRDYVNKNKFPGSLLGLSGGIDSALVLAIAIDALGKNRVHAVSLPSRYTSDLSKKITSDLTANLGVKLTKFSIEESFTAFLATLGLNPQQPPSGIVTENIQARCRAVILMALSNQTGDLLLNASNKSELAVGYGTLYGDMAGGFAVIKDVPKSMVYKLAKYRNTCNPIFPKELLERKPTAELAENQYDEDTLPCYSELDVILELYVEQDKSLKDILAAGFERKTVEKVINLVNKNEYKRRQIAVGPRTTHRAFDRERRYPITSGFDFQR